MILRFANRDEAMRWYRSPEYQSVIHLRLNSVEGTLILAEGIEAIASDLVAPRDEGHIVPDPAAVEWFRSGDLTTSGYEGWSEEIKQEFDSNRYNGAIGTDLVFENEHVRVWHMTLAPGEKMPVHPTSSPISGQRSHLIAFCSAPMTA